MDRCECEHKGHFEHGGKTPLGDPAHKYGAAFHYTNMTTVDTILGKFRVCLKCRKDCWGTSEAANYMKRADFEPLGGGK